VRDLRLTNHAIERLAERSLLKPDELIDLIQSEKLVIVGTEPPFPLNSYLLFSIKDDGFLVVTIDVRTQDVITIQPIQYWENLRKKKNYNISGRVTRTKLFEAVRASNPQHSILLYPPFCARTTVHFRGFGNFEEQNSLRSLNLFSMPIDYFLTIETPLLDTKVARPILKNAKNQRFRISSLAGGVTKGSSSISDRHNFLEHDNNLIDIVLKIQQDFRVRSQNTGRYKEFEEIDW